MRSDPLALVSQSPAWVDAMCAAGGFEDASRLYEADGGRLLVLPVLRRISVVGAATIEGSYPRYCGFGGVSASGGVRAEDVEAVFKDLASRRILRQSIIPNPLLGGYWAAAAPPRAVAISRLAHVVDLDGGFERVWSTRFSRATRSGARRAEREGVTVECDSSGRLIPVFYDLLQRSVVRWCKQQHEPLWLSMRRFHRRDPIEKFEVMAAVLGERCRVWLARVGDRPAASFLVLQDANATDIRAAMDEQLARYRANDLLLCRAIEDACEAGCRYYHLGESGASVSLARFKERFGAAPYRYAEYRLERVPITWVDSGLRTVVKRVIGFKDAR